MILAIECIAACIIFGAVIIGSIFVNKTMWLNDYPPRAVEVFLKNNPDTERKTKKENLIILIVKKLTACVIFTALLSGLVYLAGARDFFKACLYCYIIWTSVNLFDVIVLDLGLFMQWKKIRLPGTEDMDKEYASTKKKHIIDGLFGVAIGIPVTAVCGSIIHLLGK